MAAPSFEKDLEKLESVVAALEEGGLSLDDSLKRFEEGIKLAKRCEKALAEAEKKIEVLTTNADGDPETAPFNEEEAAAPDTGQAQPERKNRGGKAKATHSPPETDPDVDEDEDDDEDLLF